MMPGLDGYGVLARFRQTPRLAGVPFLFLTAKIERADQRHGMALGADDYLTKPFQEAELLSAISARLYRFRDLQPDYDPSSDGLPEFLNEARAVGKLEKAGKPVGGPQSPPPPQKNRTSTGKVTRRPACILLKPAR